MRLIDADELIEHAWRDKLDSRELIVEMIERAPTVKSIPTQIPIDVYERLLKQEPCDDAISRKAVLDKAYKYGLYGFMGDIEDIEQFPSVYPQEPKTGHWILQPSNKEHDERDFIWWKCSECGQVIYSESEKDRREYHAFCGRCGARMAESEVRNEI